MHTYIFLLTLPNGAFQWSVLRKIWRVHKYLNRVLLYIWFEALEILKSYEKIINEIRIHFLKLRHLRTNTNLSEPLRKLIIIRIGKAHDVIVGESDRKKSFYEVGIEFLDLNLAIPTLNSNFRQVNFLVYTHYKDRRSISCVHARSWNCPWDCFINLLI